MIFEKHFESLMSRFDQALACMLMGFDGLKVVSVARPGVELDLDLMGAEVSAVINQLLRASFTRQFGLANEMVIRSKQTTILLKALTGDYFVALVMKPEAHLGKGRFLLEMLETPMRQELG